MRVSTVLKGLKGAPMKRLNITILVLMAVWAYGFVALTARADIYSWTDENGVNHFTNYAPPKQAKLLIKTPEIRYDAEADNQRRENDRLEVARQELAEREAFLLMEQRAAERRIAEANAKADAALWEADRILQEAAAAAEDTSYNYSNGYDYGYGYYPSSSYSGDSSYGRHPLHSSDSRIIRDYRYSHYPGYYHKNYYRGGRHHKKHHSKYRDGRPNQHRYQKSTKRHSNRRHTTSRSRGVSHRSRTAAFRGRHGRF